MKSKKIIFAICSFMIFAVGLSGCRPMERPAPDEQNQPELRETTPGVDDRDGGTAPNMDREGTRDIGDRGNLSERADRIADAVTELEEVRSATVVITDNTAVVGVALTQDATEVPTEAERKIEDVVKETDREIDRVAVTADPDLIPRIQNIADDPDRAMPRPAELDREVNEILKRIMPNR